ncbi:MAG TPA: hypothetical protein VFR46_07350 [Actinomycetes bacterium]|nr:hypothetical protein [Actinomycetes bacterium]
MSAIAWWGIPIGATLLAMLWVTWRSRPRHRVAARETVAEYARFRAALTSASRREGRRAP